MTIHKSTALVVFLFCSFGCATKATSPGDVLDDTRIRITLLFDSVDQKIQGDAYLDSNQDLSKFTLKEYLEYLNKYQSSRALDLKKVISDFDKKEVIGFKKTFVFCAYSSKLKMAICDDPLCAKVEFQAPANTPEIIELWKKSLPLDKCSNTVTH